MIESPVVYPLIPEQLATTSKQASLTIQCVVLTEQGLTMMLMTNDEPFCIDRLAPDWQTVRFDLMVTDRVIREVRHRVMKLARSLPFSDPDLDSIETAVGEAALNAVRHGSPPDKESQLQVRCERNGGHFLIEITDEGEGFTPHHVPSPVAEDMKCSGYGIFLMHGLMDDVEYVTPPEGGTTIRLSKRYSN